MKVLTMKSPTSLAILFSILLLSACQNEVQTSESVSNDSARIDESANSKTNVDNGSKSNTTEPSPVDSNIDNNMQADENQSKPQAQYSNFTQFATALQGTWKRVDYPYGTVEFKGNEVKFTAGEGAIKPAEFEGFMISDECPATIEGQHSASAYDFLVVANERCNPIKINDNQLTLQYSESDTGVQYKRTGKANTATTSALNSIPSNFYGNWAIESKNCEGSNAKQMQITANALNFFKNKAELTQIKQFEPTRLEATFDYLNKEGSKETYFNTLDLQNSSKTLIVTENGNAPKQYQKCE